MKTEIRHHVEIDAPPSLVWEQLIDIDSYAGWNPFIRRIAGELTEGEKLVVRIAPPGGREMTFKPTVLTAEAGRELRWRGGLLVPGLFDGEHSFRVDELPGGRTRFTQSELFGGLLVGLSLGTLAKTREGFALMNSALKARAEAMAVASCHAPPAIAHGNIARSAVPVPG